MVDTLAARFWAKVNKAGPVPKHRPDLGPCWLWTAAIRKKNGYGHFAFNHTISVLAHRMVWFVTYGQWPEKTLDHLCRVRHCVNPNHLEDVSGKVNILRGIGITANFAKTTACPQGHPYNETNTYHDAKGRQCRECVRTRSREYQRKRRAANAA